MARAATRFKAAAPYAATAALRGEIPLSTSSLPLVRDPRIIAELMLFQ